MVVFALVLELVFVLASLVKTGLYIRWFFWAGSLQNQVRSNKFFPESKRIVDLRNLFYEASIKLIKLLEQEYER